MRKIWEIILIAGLIQALISGWMLFAGRVDVKHNLEDLNFKIESKLYALDQWTKNPEDAGRSVTVTLSGVLEISDWQKFLELTDPKNFDKSLFDSELLESVDLKNLKRKDIIDLTIKQKLMRDTGLFLWPPEFDSRIALAKTIAAKENLKNPQDIQEFILQKFPWYWALGPVRFEILYQRAVNAPPELRFHFDETILKARAHEDFTTRSLPIMKEIRAKQTEFLKNYEEDPSLMAAYDDGKILFENFLAGLGDNYFHALVAMTSDMLDKATQDFLAALPEKPSVGANNVFVHMIVKEWINSHIRVNQEVFEKELYPFFTGLSAYQNPANNGLWDIAIWTSLADLPADQNLRGRVLEQVFSRWLQDIGGSLLGVGLPQLFKMDGVSGIQDFQVEIQRVITE